MRKTGQKRRLPPVVVLAAFLLLPVVYLLGIGPLLFAAFRLDWYFEGIEWIFYPAFWIAERFNPYGSYLEWWLDKSGFTI
jgi:hypothetical protein